MSVDVSSNFLMNCIHSYKIWVHCQVSPLLLKLISALVANQLSPGGEMVYTLASGASARKGVEVQLLSWAQNARTW